MPILRRAGGKIGFIESRIVEAKFYPFFVRMWYWVIMPWLLAEKKQINCFWKPAYWVPLRRDRRGTVNNELGYVSKHEATRLSIFNLKPGTKSSWSGSIAHRLRHVVVFSRLGLLGRRQWLSIVTWRRWVTHWNARCHWFRYRQYVFIHHWSDGIAML